MASRIPFMTSALWAWDSVLYARALELGFHQGVDLVEQRPHAPGYLFYVLAASLARMVTGDSNAALVAVSVLASGLATAGVYLVARRFAGPIASAAAALAFAFSPLVWTYGEVAMPYALLALGSVALAGAFAAARGRPARAALVSLGFGLAAGFRQDLLPVLGPLWLWSCLPLSWRYRSLALAALAAGCLAWIIPSVALSGGLGAYLVALGAQSGRVETLSPLGGGPPELVRNLAFTLYGLFWGTLAVGMTLLVRVLAGLRGVARWPSASFFVLWFLPALVFYALVHVGDPGYVLTIVPVVFVAFAAWIDRWPRSLRAAAALAALQGVFFVASGPYALSAAVLAAHDRSVLDLQSVTHAVPADASIVVARSGYATAAYYVRDRPVRYSGESPEVLSRDATPEPPPSRPMTLVIFGAIPGLISAREVAPGVATVTAAAGEAFPAALYDLHLR